MDQSQVHLKTIQDKQVSSLQNMTKALDALAQILPPVMEKDKKRGRDDCIDHNHLTFKTMLAVFESTQPQKAAEFKKEEDLLNQQMKTSKTKQHNSYLQGKKSSFYRRRDAHILSQTLADCSKTIRNRTQELQATVATLQREQQELREELQALKKQKTQTGTNTQLECPLTPQTQAPASPFSLGSPSLLGPPSGLGSPSTFFSTPRLNPQSGADSGYDTEFAQPFTL
jgi:LmbE family N-acetylglucosaminyl deacetylase